MTSKQEIGEWFDAGVELGATHMIVVCDTFDWEDFPRYVSPSRNVRDMAQTSDGLRVMEVYNLSMDRNTQLNQHRVFNY